VSVERLARDIINCERCPRLREYCRTIAQTKRRAFREWDYWGRPVPPFGDPEARLFILGLAPAAHGANRTGRMFTGDRSGDFLYRALYETGFASQPHSVSRDDGLRLRDAWISASVRCAPPDNKPELHEILNCRVHLERELTLLRRVAVIVALGQLAFNAYLGVLKDRGAIASRASFRFGHNVAHTMPPGTPMVITSYHPSQQNTSTGKLTAPMLREVVEAARGALRSG
jgi:uracil-DNA glycosylase family 4